MYHFCQVRDDISDPSVKPEQHSLSLFAAAEFGPFVQLQAVFPKRRSELLGSVHKFSCTRSHYSYFAAYRGCRDISRAVATAS